MGRHTRPIKTKIVEIDRDMFDSLWPLMSGLLEEYHRRGRLNADAVIGNEIKPMDLKVLVFSAYQQGLQDCVQLVQKGLVYIDGDGNLILRNTKGEILP